MTAKESDIEATQKVATDIITSTERSEKEVIEKAPDGGLRAWLVTAGTACIFFSALGFSNSFGIFEEYYLSHQLKNESADKVAWIGSLAAFLQFATGALGGPLFDRYGAWVCSSIFQVIKSGEIMDTDTEKGYSAGRNNVSFCYDDDKSMQAILAVHARPRCSSGHFHGSFAIPSNGSSYPTFRQEYRRCFGGGSFWILHRWCSDPYRPVEDAEQHIPWVRMVSSDHRVHDHPPPDLLMPRCQISTPTTQNNILPCIGIQKPQFFTSGRRNLLHVPRTVHSTFLHPNIRGIKRDGCNSCLISTRNSQRCFDLWACHPGCSGR